MEPLKQPALALPAKKQKKKLRFAFGEMVAPCDNRSVSSLSSSPRVSQNVRPNPAGFPRGHEPFWGNRKLARPWNQAQRHWLPIRILIGLFGVDGSVSKRLQNAKHWGSCARRNGGALTPC